MNTIYTLLLSIIFSLAAAFAIQSTTVVDTGNFNFILCTLIVLASCVLTAITSTLLAKQQAKPTSGPSRQPKVKNTGDSNREQGQVKWFNISKGYGFVTRESGEEIFVHFRSIRGKGRRGLRDGQNIEFTVVQGEKGPQAEDVDPI